MKNKANHLQTETSEYRQVVIPADDILNSLPAHIAILDENGVIIQTNRAWQKFALSNDVMMRPDMIGTNYLSLCDASGDGTSPEVDSVSDGIRAVMAGTMTEYLKDYACHSPTEKRWFYMRVMRLTDSDPLRVVVIHENITALKLAEESLKQRKQELTRQAQDLEDLNTTLKILIKQREQDQKKLEERIVTNINQLIMPYMEKLKLSVTGSSAETYLNLIEEHLSDIVSPFLQNLSVVYRSMTPKEVMVANFIKDGKTSKDIAEIMNVSLDTVDFHRRNIRKKLGLTNQKTNLQVFLQSLRK